LLRATELFFFTGEVFFTVAVGNLLFFRIGYVVALGMEEDLLFLAASFFSFFAYWARTFKKFMFSFLL